YPNPKKIKTIVMRADHADENLVADPDPLGTISALAIDPGDSKVLYAAAGDKNHASLFVSRDWGTSWTRQDELPEVPHHIWCDPHSPADSRSLYIGGPHFVSMKTNAGLRNSPVPESVSFTDISMGFTSSSQPIIYGVSEKGVFVSKNGGSTWRQSPLPGSGAKTRAIATSSQHGDIAYVSYGNLSLGWKKWLGVAKTENGGDSWRLVWQEASAPASNVHDAWITERFGVGWAENPLELGVADQEPNVCYGTDFGRTMKTTDGGASWWAAYSRKIPSGEWVSTGLDVTNVYGIHFDPFDSNRQFLTYTDIGLFRSEDGGAGWQSSTAGVPREWLNTTYWVVFDPKVRGRMWSVNSYTHDLPRPKMWRHTDPAKFKG